MIRFSVRDVNLLLVAHALGPLVGEGLVIRTWRLHVLLDFNNTLLNVCAKST